MKAFTVTQPWATLVAIGAKRIETRSWRTSYTGLLAVHAGKGGFRKSDERGWWKDEPFFSALRPGGIYEHPLAQCGKVLAICRLVACMQTNFLQRDGPILVEDSAHPTFQMTPQERAFGDYTPGRWAWLLADVKPLPEPEAAIGSLQLWNWDEKAYWQRREGFGKHGDATTPGFFQ